MNIELGKRPIGPLDESFSAPRRAPATPPDGKAKACFKSVLKHASESAQPRRRPEGAAPSHEVRDQIISAAKADPTKASWLVDLYAYNSLGGPLLDMSDQDRIRYSASGELVTAESTAYFTRTSLAAQRGLTELYQREAAKGLPAVDILEKIFDYIDTQPLRFQEMIAW